MNRSTMPDDVRAKITALFAPKAPSPEQLRAASLAAHPDRRRVSPAHVLAGITAQNPALGDYARWIVATGARGDIAPLGRDAIEREIRLTAAAVRVLSYRRERVALQTYLADKPTDEVARRRVQDLTTAALDVERRFPGSGQRAQLALQREARMPGRAPLATTDEET